ncbi:type II toxin-antitoxin system VapC family toxin [Cupriavidus necator]|uniref:type II toxin-antitoxin system VapC family toxin n=1 Tax=Cupriavidus necator TaxID=106590 RepID=UPI00148F6539|nr:type II toxin-antitoxin system VapC family toxin [Cupriavidus necator]NOV22373.1 type II toxin-antitoxin system VapC family toxin [Cupriavidus necator]
MSVLVDTSVWVDHFRYRNDALVRLMQADQVLTHPMVVAELACGTPPAPRDRTLGDIGLLQTARQASLAEVIALIEHEKLYALGCGLVDVSLLASTLITPGARLWTLDQRLNALSARFGVAHQPRLH